MDHRLKISSPVVILKPLRLVLLKFDHPVLRHSVVELCHVDRGGTDCASGGHRLDVCGELLKQVRRDEVMGGARQPVGAVKGSQYQRGALGELPQGD